MKNTTTLTPQPLMGMLGWEEGKNSLIQLEAIPGNIVHPETFRFPIKFIRVKGANYRTVVEQSNEAVLAEMIKAAREMEAAGVKVITTSCGFNAIFQKELANAVAVPVFSSSLMQVPMVYNMLKNGTQYVDPGANNYDDRQRRRILKSLRRRAQALGYELVTAETSPARPATIAGRPGPRHQMPTRKPATQSPTRRAMVSSTASAMARPARG